MVAEVEMPEISTSTGSLAGKKLILILDEIKDPGNMGSLIRSAYNLGWEGVVIIGNAVDPFNDKALRGAKGFTFAMSITKLPDWTAMHSLADVNSTLGKETFKGLLSGNVSKKILRNDIEHLFLVVSNESRGASREAKAVSKPITVPMVDGSSGVNVGVAGGILMMTIKHWWDANKNKTKS